MTTSLVIQAARFGDLVQSKRLLLSLMLQGEVHLLVDKNLAPLAELLYPAVHVYPFYFHGKLDAASLKHNRALLGELSQSHFSKIYNCNYSPLTAALCRLFSAEIVGYRPVQASQGGIVKSPLLRLVAQMTAHRTWATFNLEDVWAYFTPNPVAPEKVNPVAEGQGKGIGVVLAGREERRSLPVALLADILKVYWKIKNEPPIYLLGTISEKSLAHQLQRHLPPGLQKCIKDLSGQTSFKELFAVLQGLDLLITPDTGTMHLAAALGVPIRAFFLSSAWCHETGPYGSGHLMFQVAGECAPCLEQAPCTKNLCCLEPLRDRTLLRTILHIEQGQKLDSDELAPNLQCWQGGLDPLGQHLTLVAGEDRAAEMRRSLRQLLAAYLQVDLGCCQPIPSEIAELFSQDQEWMLPNTRYA
ncbi:MAG: glycosyltransferase family 9 protein [Desulfovibrionaceae bacterium]|nr:glycosyltransferase family 9 protein [Desulfovibrionaceae bacterium]